MEDERWPTHISYRDDDDRIQYFLGAVLERGLKPPPEYALALLIKSVERLKASTDENLKGIERLKDSTEKSSNEANLLSSAIKKLTRWLVWLTATAVILAVLSLYVLFRSAK